MRKPLSAGSRRGSASVLVIMVLLLLVVFGVLAFASGGSSLRLAEKNARTVKNYYLLDRQGELALGRLTLLLREGASLEALKEALGQMEHVTVLEEDPKASEEPRLTWRVADPAVAGGATLLVSVQVTGTGAESPGLRIQRWELEYEPLDYEAPVELWEGVN